MKISRNDPCPCGSGIKYKKCCLQEELEAMATEAPKTSDADHGRGVAKGSMRPPASKAVPPRELKLRNREAPLPRRLRRSI